MSATPTHTPPHAAFAARLKSARLRCGKSQEQIAAEVGTSRRHWIRWERGDHLPSTLFIARIAEATGATPETLSGIVPATPAGSDTEDDAEADPAMRDAFALFCDLMDRLDAVRSVRAVAS